jgi:ElaB/YqjD/DUF883 family membrane-anchored ribosome-binding protein
MAASTTTNPKDLANEANQFVSKAKETAADAMDKVKQTAQSFGETASKKACEATAAVGSSVSSGMKNLGEKIRENMPSEGYLGQASRSVADTLQQGGEYLSKEGFGGLADDVGGVIKRNPLPAVMIGLGIGFLIGRTLRK